MDERASIHPSSLPKRAAGPTRAAAWFAPRKSGFNSPAVHCRPLAPRAPREELVSRDAMKSIVILASSRGVRGLRAHDRTLLQVAWTSAATRWGWVRFPPASLVGLTRHYFLPR